MRGLSQVAIPLYEYRFWLFGVYRCACLIIDDAGSRDDILL
jgi:hypothetical protein